MTSEKTQPLERSLEERFGPFEELTALAPDASVRSFFRGRRSDGSSQVLVVDQNSKSEGLDRVVAARELFASIRVRVPEITDREDTLSALMMEDLGDRLLADRFLELSEAEKRHAYAQAGAMAARIALSGGPAIPEGNPLLEPILDQERARGELAFFAVHDVANRRGLRDSDLLGDLRLVLDHIAQEVGRPARSFAHRDFHARNLMLLDDGSLALVDFQDALFAPPFYDLVSLLYDPYVPLDDGTRQAACAAYTGVIGQSLEALDNPVLSWVALERLLKVIGTYAFQTVRREKGHFEQYIAVAEKRALQISAGLSSEMSGPITRILERIGFSG